jgi:hypothetical protein
MVDNFNNIRFEHRMVCFQNTSSTLDFLVQFKILNEISCSTCNGLTIQKFFQRNLNRKFFCMS